MGATGKSHFFRRNLVWTTKRSVNKFALFICWGS